jgi:hypothetical protein
MNIRTSEKRRITKNAFANYSAAVSYYAAEYCNRATYVCMSVAEIFAAPEELRKRRPSGFSSG